jgi:hypothetical protein
MLYSRIPATTLAADPIASPATVVKENLLTISTSGGGPVNLAFVCSVGSGPMAVEVYGRLEAPAEAFLNTPVAPAAVQWFLVGTIAAVSSGQISFLGTATLVTVVPTGIYYIRPTTGLAAGAFVAVTVMPVADV